MSNATTESDFEPAFFVAVARQRIGALLVSSDSLFHTGRDRLVALAARHRLPATYRFREYVVAAAS